MERGGIIDLFERRFSVYEGSKRHKPAAYGSVADTLGLDPGDVCLLACHVWDTVGALAAGCHAGLILRAVDAPLPAGPQPTYPGADLNAIADQLIARHASASTS